MAKLKFIIISLLFLFSCVSIEKQIGQKMRLINTYDDALYFFGTPSKTTEGEKIFIAEWEKSETSFGVVPVGGIVVGGTSKSGYILRITFDKETKKVHAWQVIEF